MPKVEARIWPRLSGLSPRWVAGIVSTTLSSEKAGQNTTVGILVTNDAQIQKINKKFLKHDTATDVIAFNLDKTHLGDIVVSAETARKCSARLKISFREELARYLVHGTLHLLGYRDKKKNDRARMHTRQEMILKKVI